ncbi:ATPase, T2SS/T4P/T4SS family [Aquabacterium sp. A7-Y]|uniref:ATPase, T2SS/T4P/T4SS family n=1 Tax=Aquabacterium sp. A7-Y TaxID=1349605 RepID=UPI00223D7D5A|nr:ATPase, T2SS/T4P/T4SS family [Aquabacterium sp. A7-Y]MCW7540692.1 ATPase, T2SS/T4P/T4SS family [Aquabacterium sp. A7-Y]
MFHVEIVAGKERRQLEVPDDAIIGRSPDCEVRLESWRISREHARLYRTPSGVVVEDLGGMGGVFVNGKRVPQYGPLAAGDRIEVGPFQLRVVDEAPAPRTAMKDGSLAKPVPPAAGGRSQEEVRAHLTDVKAARIAKDEEQRLKAAALEYQWRRRSHERLLELMDLRRKDVSRMSDEQLHTEIDVLVREVITELQPELPPDVDQHELRRQTIHEAIGLGPLEDLLADESVTEVMVNRHDEIYIERSGRLQRHPVYFTSDRAVMAVIERIVAPLGRRIDESSPMVDARLKDGSRVNAIIPPLAIKGPTVTIRKFSKKKLTTEDLVGYNALSVEMAEFLRICVEHRKNIVVSGGTGSGKTTLLNILSNYIPSGERILTIEDAAELKLPHPHLVSLEARPANVEGRGAVTIRELVRNALRMRPDRIVVGECRGAEALDMLQAMNTGHEGSMTTLHANAPRDALARLETLVLMAGMDLPLPAIREQVASAVDIIVQQTRFSCGARKVTRIVEITGMEGGKLQLQELFKFEHRGYGTDGQVQGHFAGCETVPSFFEEFSSTGRVIDLELFRAKA